MVYAPVRSITPELKLGDYLSVQAHKPCSISHLLALWYDKVFGIRDAWYSVIFYYENTELLDYSYLTRKLNNLILSYSALI